MSAPSPSRPLAELRKAYQAHLSAHGGRCEDASLAQSMVAALEKELALAELKLSRTGTVYTMPKVQKTPAA